MKTTSSFPLFILLVAGACTVEVPSGRPGDPNDPNSCATQGLTHIGFESTELNGSRESGVLGKDRLRLKAHKTLTDELKRVLGVVPANFDKAASSFGTPPARWASEPITSSVAMTVFFEFAFAGCLQSFANQSEFSAAPTKASAATKCGAWARKFWSRSPTQAEVDSCVAAAVDDAASDPDPKRKWAYACAAVLNTANFLSY